MGQPITVTVRAGAAPDIRFFECNRSLTGMAIEVYTADSEALVGAAPARRARAAAARRRRDQGHDLLQRRDGRGAGRGVGRARAQGVFTIEHLFEFYGDDAGWSFEARGVEPEISKVQ